MAKRKTTTVKRRRKPMSEEQRLAAVERLAKARAKRAASNPPPYKNIHPDVLALDEDHTFSFKNVRGWLKHQQDLLTAHKQSLRQGDKGALAKVTSTEGYIKNINAYLSSNCWIDDYYGENRDNRMIRTCIAMAYDDDGYPKREKGTFYPDLGFVWGEEPEEDEE